MSDKSNTTAEVAELLQRTKEAHHDAFAAVDGADPDWPLWYAQYCHEALSELLPFSVTVSELVSYFIQADALHAVSSGTVPWTTYYAHYFLARQYDKQASLAVDMVPASDLPALTTEQMVEVDRAMVEEYGITLTQMMENAGRNLAHLARARFLAGDPAGKYVAVLAGRGANGGGALAAARHLSNYGAQVVVALSYAPESFSGAPAQQLATLQQMKVAVETPEELLGRDQLFDLVIDGLIGYGLAGTPSGKTATLIQWANEQKMSVLALDIPSGINGTTGETHDPSITAAATLTLALPKRGLFGKEATLQVGELYLADIGVPPSLYARPPFALNVGPIFAHTAILRVLANGEA